MPKYCAAEGCGNSVVRCETSAHTFPKDEKLCYLWSRLARPSFPTWVPSKSDRLCSEHFRDEDYIRSPSALKSVHLPTKHNRLNPGALPSVFSKKRKPEDLAEHIEKRRKVVTPHCSPVTQACIKPPSRTRFVQTDVSGTMVWCSSPSHGDDALDTDLDLSDVCPPRAEADSSYCLSEDSFARPEKEAPSSVHERKFIVFESCLDQLLETCRSCAAPNTHIDKTVQGSSLQVSTLCRSGHTATWCSQPIIKRKPVGNILVAAAILFTGCSIKKALRMLTSMGIACFCYKTFFIIQKAFLLPAIEKVWNKHQLELVSAAAGRQLVIAGDGRADSPGHSAKYGTYTMLDVEDNKVLHVETVQSNETGGSYHMELEGLRRSLDIFEAHSLVVAVLVTDRHPQLSAWLEREHPDICHLFDCWHVAKAIKKKLVAAGKSRHSEDLSSWTKSVVNHLYWSAGSSAEDQDLILPKWCSLVAHVANVHTHLDPLFPECQHKELNKKWLLEGKDIFVSSPAHQKLKEIVLSKHLLRDIPSLSPSAQTFATECFHSTLLNFAPKLVHFGFRSMTARTYLAALHYNENAARPQATTKEGERRWAVKYPKARKEAVAAMLKGPCTYEYVGELMAAVLDISTVMPSYKAAAAHYCRDAPPFLSSAYERADKRALAENHYSRFNS
ncbi:hypothetical protein HPB47_015658 [Ixodes persulcatus]|uniref:Uncharacterized protein n=1 Tax=Ixodes persulcatus TaxID=34615 RepID=A0AC60QWF1_IXOPE|nr:hypothetical protein HPB47_015658 [Ixodes persulcatus]